MWWIPWEIKVVLFSYSDSLSACVCALCTKCDIFDIFNPRTSSRNNGKIWHRLIKSGSKCSSFVVKVNKIRATSLRLTKRWKKTSLNELCADWHLCQCCQCSGKRTFDLNVDRRQTSTTQLQEKKKSWLQFAKPKNLSFYTGCSVGEKAEVWKLMFHLQH